MPVDDHVVPILQSTVTGYTGLLHSRSGSKTRANASCLICFHVMGVNRPLHWVQADSKNFTASKMIH